MPIRVLDGEGLGTAFGPEKGPFNPAAKFKTKAGEAGWQTVRPDAKGYVDYPRWDAEEREASAA